MKFLLPFLLIFSLKTFSSPPVVELKRDMIITRSISIKNAVYLFNGYDSLNRPLLQIKGNNITIDFNNAFLQGSNDRQLPNQFYGLAILIKGNNITLKNASIRGFKIAIMALGCKNLRIENSDFSYNYRQHLQSNWLGEDVSDWMSYHHNENDEWLRYGAGIYMKDCKRFIITKNTITGGQCGLMMMRCNDGMVTNNNFSFNSALGIGMYKSSRNKILHNKLDFNVRGYSHGFYNRGQDSGGLLVFEQCNENVFAYNSATHSGDGFFLWAGQTTMDNGEGGCNNNYIYKNNFSYAPTNGVEVTFSKNIIKENIINECDHGIWGGYSWETSITGNEINNNRIGVAIEHGQNNAICSNIFSNNRSDAIKLWARKTQPTDWGYANKRDTRSMKYLISGNYFKDEKRILNIALTDNIIFTDNLYGDGANEIKKDSTVTNFEEHPAQLLDTPAVIPPIIRTWKQKTIPISNFPYGRNQIRITPWGPYDFGYPLLFLKKIDSNGLYHFDVLGPKGRWKLKNSRDLKEISRTSGQFPEEITALRTGHDVQIELEYTGVDFINQFGKPQPGKKPLSFNFRDYSPDLQWDVKWYRWFAESDPIKNYDEVKVLSEKTAPFKTETTKEINFTWWGEVGKNLPADSFLTIATSTINVQKGNYQLGITADDLVKVYVDGKLVIDFWDIKKYVYDEDTHHDATVELDGKHDIRIEHLENGGYATLIFTLKPI